MMEHLIDLRSDTITKPCQNMRRAMIEAIVGDDVYDFDPTIKELETRMAKIAEKEAALYVVSGTMGNLLSILSHTGRRGAEVLLGDCSHIHIFEQGNIAQFGGVNPLTVPTQADGTFLIEDVENGIRMKDDYHFPVTQLICIENTHVGLGGKVLPLNWIDQLCDFAHEKGIPVHMDGARVFSASVASNVSVGRILEKVDSASICFSKNLGAPIGSVIVGKKEFIEKARYLRKGLGGGWRQAGVVAATAIYAIENNIEKLQEDHKKAKAFATAVHDTGSKNIFVKIEDVHTHIVLIHVNLEVLTPDDLLERLMKVETEEELAVGSKVYIKAFTLQAATSIRLVFHLHISQELLELAIAKMVYVIREIDNANRCRIE